MQGAFHGVADLIIGFILRDIIKYGLSTADSRQLSVWFGSSGKLSYDHFDHDCQLREAHIVEVVSASYFPHALNRIECRTVGTAEKPTCLLRAPVNMKFGMMIYGVVGNHSDLPPPPTSLAISNWRINFQKE